MHSIYLLLVNENVESYYITLYLTILKLETTSSIFLFLGHPDLARFIKPPPDLKGEKLIKNLLGLMLFYDIFKDFR